ncbi:uncharacterized protein LOC122505742 [Leptopilina heterotoma]|uniref:uncharacterized protein LOC122505742 n=1 Tax=Leptopilina heterotoma TaxID=63436 RepID=UPI001CA8006B|nr:uncharacterized protein LOC122505742 [Leptopilina heterotoma]
MTNNTLVPNERKYGAAQQINSAGYTHNLSNNLSTDIENAIGTHSRVRSPTSRRGSISLSAVVHHRRALFGALISRIGSNISLPSTLNQDQDLTLNNPSVYNQIAQIAPLNLTESKENLDSGNNNLEKLLKLTPVNAENIIPLSNLNVNGRISVKTVQNRSCPKRNSHAPHAEFISSISILYAKLLIVVGVAIPVTASVSQQVPPALDQGFYLYLYIVSVVFLITLYSTLLRDKAVKNLLVKHAKREERCNFNDDSNMEISLGDDYKQTVKNHFHRRQVQQYGSFCLRLGTVGFGAGSLVFTGLQIGAEIVSGPFRAITPTARLLLVMAQMHFIFLNSKCLELTKHGAFAKLGLMHMIATNLCEWLQALVEETQHEIVQLEHAHEGDDGILKTLLRDASPFLFPCTIEFSLICAVILFEMWKCVDKRVTNSTKYESSARSLHHLSIDCGSAHSSSSISSISNISSTSSFNNYSIIYSFDIKTMDFQKVNATGCMERFLPTKPLSELTVNELYNVTKINKVQTKYGSRIVVDLDATFTTFLPARFAKLFDADPTSFTMMEEAVQLEKLRLKYIGGKFNVIEFE